MEDNPRSRRPSTSKRDENVSRVSDLFNTDRWMSVQMMAVILNNIPKTAVHDIVSSNFHMRKGWAKFVFKLLTNDHINNRVTIAIGVLERVQYKPDFLDHSLVK